MKIARVLLLAALLLSAFASSASASDEAVGYIQLTSGTDTNQSITFQAHRALQRLKPQLLAAQEAGQIIRYEAFTDAGVLMIVYRPSAGVPSLAGRQVFNRMEQAVPAAAMAAGPAPAPLCSPTRFQLYMYAHYFMAECLEPGALVLGSVRDTTGRVVLTYSGTASPAGQLTYAYFTYGGGGGVVPGYTVTFKEYVGASLVAAFQTKVPNVKFTSMDKGNAILRGIGPAGKTATLTWEHAKWDAAETVMEVSKDRAIQSNGTWQVDFGTTPIRGGDYLGANVHSTANFDFHAYMYSSYLWCELGGYYCELAGYPFAPATLQIIHGGQTYNFSGTFDEEGWFWIYLQDASGAPIYLVTWDKVSGTGVTQYALPKLTANINATTNTISGKAPAYKYFDLDVYVSNLGTWYFPYAHSNGSGNYTVNMMTAYGVDLLPGRPYVIDLDFVLPSTGNETYMMKAYGP